MRDTSQLGSFFDNPDAQLKPLVPPAGLEQVRLIHRPTNIARWLHPRHVSVGGLCLWHTVLLALTHLRRISLVAEQRTCLVRRQLPILTRPHTYHIHPPPPSFLPKHAHRVPRRHLPRPWRAPVRVRKSSLAGSWHPVGLMGLSERPPRALVPPLRPHAPQLVRRRPVPPLPSRLLGPARRALGSDADADGGPLGTRHAPPVECTSLPSMVGTGSSYDVL